MIDLQVGVFQLRHRQCIECMNDVRLFRVMSVKSVRNEGNSFSLVRSWE